MTYDMKNALQRISLASHNNTSLDECGRIASEALAAEEARESKSWHDEHAEDLERRREQHAFAVNDYVQRFDMNSKVMDLSQRQIEDIADVRSAALQDEILGYVNASTAALRHVKAVLARVDAAKL